MTCPIHHCWIPAEVMGNPSPFHIHCLTIPLCEYTEAMEDGTAELCTEIYNSPFMSEVGGDGKCLSLSETISKTINNTRKAGIKQRRTIISPTMIYKMGEDINLQLKVGFYNLPLISNCSGNGKLPSLSYSLSK
jgi:hypothetical protein